MICGNCRFKWRPPSLIHDIATNFAARLFLSLRNLFINRHDSEKRFFFIRKTKPKVRRKIGSSEVVMWPKRAVGSASRYFRECVVSLAADVNEKSEKETKVKISIRNYDKPPIILSFHHRVQSLIRANVN